LTDTALRGTAIIEQNAEGLIPKHIGSDGTMVACTSCAWKAAHKKRRTYRLHGADRAMPRLLDILPARVKRIGRIGIAAAAFC